MLLQQQQLYLQLELEMQQKQQQLTNQQLTNQRIELNHKDQEKANGQSNSMTSCKGSLDGNSTTSNKIVNESEPNSPMQISKESAQHTSMDHYEQDNEKDDINNITILNTSMINTSMSNSPVQMTKQSKSDSSSSIIDCFTDLNKIEEMKVNDLKQELKRLNLPVSGSKTTLIERLKNYVSKSRAIKSSNSSPIVIESMDVVDSSPKAHLSSSSSSPSLNANSSITTITPVTTNNQQNLFTNTISSTPVTTFATLAPSDASNLLGTTAFLTTAQNPAILRPTFNAQNPGFLTTANKPPPNGGQLIKTQTSLTNVDLKSKDTNQGKPRRISEPQLQHIQLHFTNPFLQFATQSSLNAAPLTNRNSGAQQIHFLSTPALNTNDLHLFTQPTTLLTSNNRILQSASSPFTTNQPTTWTLQPSNNFPQLFFYPTQLTAAATNSNLIANSPPVPATTNLLTSTAASSTTSLNANSNECNPMLQTNHKPDPYSSDSELVVTTTAKQPSKARQKSTGTKVSKPQTKSTNKASKNDLNNKKTSISQSSNSANSNLNNNCPIDNRNKNSLCNVNNSVTTISQSNGSLSNQSLPTGNLLNAGSYPTSQSTNYVHLDLKQINLSEPETRIAESNHYTPSIIGQQQSYEPTNSYALQNASSSLQGYFTPILVDKQPPPPYEEATAHLNSKRNQNVQKTDSQSNSRSNLTFSTTAASLNRSNEEQLNNVIGMNANYSTNSNNSFACNPSIAKQQSSANSMQSNMQTANLINSANIGTEPTNATDKTFRRQSSSLEFRNLNSRKNSMNFEFIEPNANCLAHGAGEQQQPKSTEFYSVGGGGSGANTFGNTNSFESNSHESFESKHTTMNEYSSSASLNDQSYHFSQGINSNCYSTNLVNRINQQISHQINTSVYQMETDDATNSLNQSSNISNKPEVDFNLDFDLLMEVPDFFDSYNETYSKACTKQENCDQNCNENCDQNKIQNHIESNFMEIDTNRLTIDTNFDDAFNCTEQSLHTPTLPEDAFEAVDQEQIINNLIDTNNTNSIAFNNNAHHFSSIGYNDQYDLLFQNS